MAHQRIDYESQGDLRIGGKRGAQAPGARFAQSFGQRLRQARACLLFRLGNVSNTRLVCRRRRGFAQFGDCLRIGALDETLGDDRPPVAVDRDRSARVLHQLRIKHARRFTQAIELGVHLVTLGPKKIVLLGVLQLLVQSFEPRFQRGDLFSLRRLQFALRRMQPLTGAAVDLAVTGQGLDPTPAFGGKRLTHLVEALDGKPLQQLAIVEEDDVCFKEIADQTPSGRFVCFGANETRQTIVCGNAPHRQRAPDARSMCDGLCELTKHPLLGGMIVIDRKCARNIQIDVAFTIGRADLRRKPRQRQTLFDEAHSTAKASCYVIDAHAAINQAREGFDLVHHRHGRTRDILIKTDLGGVIAGIDDATQGLGIGNLLALNTQELRLAPPLT
ncbi:hypothetical protein DYH09_33375, partial [bacterium CPR1]|nr:hypothetical protein [bacterium CPR1]